MFWNIYYKLVVLLRPFATLGLRIFSRATDTKRARVLIHRNNQILLVRDIFSRDVWSIAGGGLNRNEKAADAASRELLEELGIMINPSELKLLGEIERYSEEDQTYTAVLYSHEVKDELNLNVHKWEIVEAKWFDISSLPEKRTSSVGQALRLLRQG